MIKLLGLFISVFAMTMAGTLFAKWLESGDVEMGAMSAILLLLWVVHLETMKED